MKARAQTLALEAKEPATETVKQELFVEQAGRRLYRTNKRDLLIQELLPSPGGNGNGHGEGDGNGGGKKTPSRVPHLRNRISSYLFEYLKGFHVSTHFVGERDGAEMLVKYAEPIPLLVKVFNAAEEQWPSRFGPEATGKIELPVIEHYLTGSGNAPSWVNEYHLYAFNLLKPEEFRQVNRLASKVNAVLRGLSERRDLFLAGLQLTFGRYNNGVIVTGEISNLTCRFQEAPMQNRTAGFAYKPVDTSTEDGLERLYSRLKLNG